tara:strand:+ start:1016 stop:2083 length:1068 start_codon:yes stop_codon:yes gene_type:complete
MTDYFKVGIIKPSKVIRELDYYSSISQNTGEVKGIRFTDPKGMFETTTYRETYEYQGIVFKKATSNKRFLNSEEKKSTYYTMEGSLHKFNNGGKYNFDRFSYSDFILAMDKICLRFSLNPWNLKLTNLEFGLNINLPITSKNFISFLKTNKQKEHSITPYTDGGIMLEFHFDQYRIKCYDKGTQNKKLFNTPETLFRYEIHAKKAQYLDKLGVSTLGDLYNKDVWRTLNNTLLKTFDQTVIFNGQTRGKTPKKQTMISNMNNREFWKSLNKDSFKRFKTHCNNPELNNVLDLKKQVYDIMNLEFEEVINAKEKHPRFYDSIKTQITPVFNPSIEGKNEGLNSNTCFITNVNIKTC